MESSGVLAGGLHTKHILSPPYNNPTTLLFPTSTQRLFSPSSLKLHNQLSLTHSATRSVAATASSTARETIELADICWDDLGFGLVDTDYMYYMKCSSGGSFSKGELRRFGKIELSPSAGVLNYGQGVVDDGGKFDAKDAAEEVLVVVVLKVLSVVMMIVYGQGLFEGLKAYRREGDSILLFRPEENALRMRMGAERMCMPSPTADQFVEAVKLTVLANKRWVPPQGKGSLYIRPLLMGSGAVLGLAPAPEYTFLIYVSPVGNYFKEGLAPINLVVENEFHRAAPGGTGGIKTIGNYASVLKAQSAAKAKGYSDVLYLDSVQKRYLEEVSSCNVFVVKGKTISTPAIKGTILPGITRKSIIDVARTQGFQVEERLVAVEELLDADEVFCTGTAVVVSPVGSITYLGKR
ncbi:hypothetical protein GIB67_005305 [Kingdonia uniflora]|nr:hypothetical protein GIB67_005305 [Kingdonia uniflora]